MSHPSSLQDELQTSLASSYRVDREIGGGGMSRVYAAEDLALGRTVVIKLLAPDLCGVVNVERFRREIQVAARLQHGHVVPVLSMGDVNGIPYYTMPFIEGESLRKRLDRAGPLPLAEAIGVLRDVAKALAFAHEHQIIHRDIKPDNVLLAGGSALVTDFGVAKAISESRAVTQTGPLTQAGAAVGTPAYMSPEQAASDPDLDHRADLYAFGCMAFEILTGRTPFVETSLHKLFTAHLTRTPPAPHSLRPDLPPALSALILRCLAKDADQRPASAAAVLTELEAVTSGGHAIGGVAPWVRLTRTAISSGEHAFGTLLISRLRLTALLLLILAMNLVQTSLDPRISAALGGQARSLEIVAAMRALEGDLSFAGQDLVGAASVYGASIAYFLLFPLMTLAVVVATARRRSIHPYRVLASAIAIDYLLSIPFYLLFPVRERWSIPDAGATLLSNQWSLRLIETIRPLSAIDNSFPSFHVSLSVVLVGVCFLYGLRFRWAWLFCGLAIIASTFLLGIHWVPDLIAGAATGCIALTLAVARDLRGLSRSSASQRRIIPAVAAVVLLLCPGTATAQRALSFSAVAVDADSRRADDLLRRYLENVVGVSFVAEEASTYSNVIDYLATRKATDSNYVARVTPYALVAAELLGARVQVLGTYVSRATSATTYRAYLVVRRNQFLHEPELAGLVNQLRAQSRPATFAFHSEFSTSSYFLPAIHFRQNQIFDMSAPTEQATAIRAVRINGGTADLVKGVATGQFDVAAVWSGTKASFERTDSLARYASRVFFVPLPDALPNDLFIASASMDSATVARLRQALATMPPQQISVGAFVTWRSINDAVEAREALANLRWLARAAPAPVTVDVQLAPEAKGRIPERHLAAARQAVRLAGAEFVNFDRDYHFQQDYVLTLAPGNDGSILLRSRIVGSDRYDQTFQVSFYDDNGLVRSIADLLRNRVHRVRYLWPYRASPPTILRDLDLELAPGTVVEGRMIRWTNPRRNSYSQDARFESSVAVADPSKIELSGQFIAPPDAEGFAFNPMSNISYRVILPRVMPQRPLFRIVSFTILAFLTVAAVAALLELRRLVAVLPSEA